MFKLIAPLRLSESKKSAIAGTASGRQAASRLARQKRKLFQPELLESRWVQAAMPFGAVPNDTGEFMLGRVAVTPVFLESTGEIDASTENWNQPHKDEVVAKLNEGFEWWRQLLATQSQVHNLEFVIDTTYIDNPSPTVYEPINRRSDDFSLWSQEFLMRIGYDESSSLELNMRAFNHDQRVKANANWAFTIFVVNSQVDAEGTFAPGTFSRAFAFAGGLFFVVPSTRPASTFAHETGHIFWSRDEYAGSASFFARRGYYNTQNTNAIDGNPNPNFQQAPSIMSAGDSLTTAYANVVSPASTLGQLGWQDTDGDGIFDVLDVPLALEGVGRINLATGNYNFVGKAKVQTLPNRNSSGLGNDITLNRISRIEAKINDGPWKTVASPDVYEANLNISIPLEGAQSGTIQIRAIDQVTGITSNVFQGTIGALPDATPVVGINGFVFNDANANGLFDATETGMANQTVRLVNAAGQPLLLQRAVDPDAQVPGSIPANAYPNVVLSTFGNDSNGTLASATDPNATTGTRVFRPYSISRGGFAETWNTRRRLQVDFLSLTSYVSIDVIGAGTLSYGRMEAYDINENLIARTTSQGLVAGQFQKLEIGRDTADIAYVVVFGHMETGVKIDNLRYGPAAQTTTDSFGRYSFANLPSGEYNVEVILPAVNATVTTSGGAKQSVELQASPLQHVNYGLNFQVTPWHNSQLPADVNDDGVVTAIDALLVINLLNLNTPSDLRNGSLTSPPYVDVSNDAFLTALDALLVINVINGASGEGETTNVSSDSIVAAGGGLSLEGEACLPYEGPTTPTVFSADLPVAEGEFMGPVAPANHQEEPCPVEQLAVDQAKRTENLIARLLANPWSTPQPCHCPECLAVELTNLRLS